MVFRLYSPKWSSRAMAARISLRSAWTRSSSIGRPFSADMTMSASSVRFFEYSHRGDSGNEGNISIVTMANTIWNATTSQVCARQQCQGPHTDRETPYNLPCQMEEAIVHPVRNDDVNSRDRKLGGDKLASMLGFGR